MCYRIFMPRPAGKVPKRIGRETNQGDWTNCSMPSGVSDLASSYCVLQAVDILNALPTTANPSDGTTDATGFSPHMQYYSSQPLMDNFYAFGSYCSVHMDIDHSDATNKNVTASPCVYLCSAGHFHSKGHVVWDYKRRRKLIVPEISRNIWNYFPMRSGPAKHISDLLTFVTVEARVDDDSGKLTSKAKSSDGFSGFF